MSELKLHMNDGGRSSVAYTSATVVVIVGSVGPVEPPLVSHGNHVAGVKGFDIR